MRLLLLFTWLLCLRNLNHKPNLKPNLKLIAPSMNFRPWQLLLLESCRSRQWPKNLLVFAAPLFALRLNEDIWLKAGIALVAFCLISSAIYLLTDSLDVAAYWAHFSKRYRPIAAVRECSPFT